MSHEMNIRVKRGTTLKSGKIFSVVEGVSPDIGYGELMAGIADGTYTLNSLTGKTYTGQVRDRAGAALRGTLQFSTAGNILTFSLPASVTKDWPNDTDTMFYDVFETTTLTGEVKEKVFGKIFIEPAITVEA